MGKVFPKTPVWHERTVKGRRSNKIIIRKTFNVKREELTGDCVDKLSAVNIL